MTTLDTRVKKRLADFDTVAATLQDLEDRHAELQRQLRAADQSRDPTGYFAIQDALLQLKPLLSKARDAETDKIAYLLNAIPYIRQYESESPRHGGLPLATTPAATPSATPAHKTNDVGQFVTVTGTTNKRSVFMEYMRDVEGVSDETVSLAGPTVDECAECGCRLVIDSVWSAQVCTGCGVTTQIMEGGSRNLTYDEEMHIDKRTAFSYKRLNHLTEYLNSIQAKENTIVPEEVLDAVKNEFKKNRLTSKRDITADRVRVYLKKLNLAKFYEHKHTIASAINGVPARRIPEELETQMKKLFMDLQAPFERHCPPHRNNFLSYAYVCYQFCRLLDADEYLDMFTMLKSKDKLYQQDRMWEKITGDLKWQFLPTV